jgi:hypothetical protein
MRRSSLVIAAICLLGTLLTVRRGRRRRDAALWSTAMETAAQPDPRPAERA